MHVFTSRAVFIWHKLTKFNYVNEGPKRKSFMSESV